MTSRAGPPAREPVALQRYLEGVFGELTQHAFESLEVLPTRITCTGCRNNTAKRRDAVCETHVGVLCGVFQAMTHVPMQVAYAADPGGNCVITLKLATLDGVPVTPFATRLDHVELHQTAGQAALLDRSRSPAELAAATGLPDAAVRTTLDQLYTAGWISCRFDRAA